MKVGDIIKWEGKYNYYIGVVMGIEGGVVFVQDMSREQNELPASKAELATVEDMAEELRCLYGYYH